MIWIATLLILSIILNIIFFIKLNKSNKKIEKYMNESLLDGKEAWGNFEQIIK